MTWPKKATNVPNLSLFFERLPKDRVKEQYPFFYSRTGDDMFFTAFTVDVFSVHSDLLPTVAITMF